MPTVHFIFHAYGSWLPDHPDGYHDRKSTGLHTPNLNLARSYQAAMTRSPTIFDRDEQILLMRGVHQIAENFNWEIQGTAVVDTHIHIIVSWRDGREASRVKQILKSQLTRTLNGHIYRNKGKRFSRGSGDRRIRDLDHLIELIQHYFPEHGDNVWIADKLVSHM